MDGGASQRRVEVTTKRKLFESLGENRGTGRIQLTSESFSIIEVLGKGSTGNIYKARLKGTNELCALKCIHLSSMEKSHSLARIQNEVRILCTVRESEFVVDLLGFFEDDTYAYLVMEYIEGESLAKLLDVTPKLREKKAVAILRDLILALEDIQWKGVVHRDLKPSNIIVGHSGRCKLIGFGLAAVLEYGETKVDDGMLVGTLDYMAPEVLNGDSYDYQADIWSAGALFYECLAGLPPFASLESVRQLQVDITKENIRKGQPNFNLAGAVFSEEAKDLISRMLYKKQDDRITLDELKQHEIFKKHKIEFEGDARTPRQSFMQHQISLSNNKRSVHMMSTPRNCSMLDHEKQLIERDINRKKTVHMSFKNMSKAITLVDGDSVKKIDTASFFLHQTTSEGSRRGTGVDSTSPGLASTKSNNGSRSFLLESLGNLSPTHIKTFEHAAVSTEPIQNLAEEMDNEFRRFMGFYNKHYEKTQKLSSIKSDNDRMVREINDLETQIVWKNTAISHGREELNQAESFNRELEAKLTRNRDRAMETLTKKNEEIKALEEEIEKLMTGIVAKDTSKNNGK